MEDASLKVNLNENQNSDALIIDQNAQQLQQTLLEMGYDLSMINKVITHFHVKTKDEAIYYLSKNDDLWNHPFIPLEEEPAQSSNAFANAPQNLMSKAFTQFGGEVNQKCEICGEYAETHRFVHHEEKKEDNVVIEEHKEENLLIEEKKEEDSQLCGICLGELENPLQMQGCSHRFCRGCFYDYLVNKISINDIEAIPCPNKECGNKKLSEEFFIQYLSEEQAYKYATFKSKNEIAKDPYKVFCPLCDSYAEIPRDTKFEKDILSNNQLPQSELTCIKNNHKFCSCGRPLHEGKCYVPGEDIKKFIQNQKIKKCPNCGFLIYEDRGCNHMICGNPLCKYEFCWLCMQESLPDHYRYGQCAGLQFADEDGLMMKLRGHPCLLFIYNFFHRIYSLIVFVLFIACPIIFVIQTAYSILFLSATPFFKFKEPKSSSYHKCVNSLFFVGLTLGLILLLPIFYPLYILGLFLLITWLMFSTIKCVLYCLFCCCCCDKNNNNNNNQYVYANAPIPRGVEQL